jgi:hypothetical protein
MSNAHPRPWHRGSVFVAPRRALDRDQRARFRYLLSAHYRAGHVTAKGEKVGHALLKRLGSDGRCDPSHQTLADDATCDEKTVRRALETFKALGLVTWACRVVRSGWRVLQTTNAYVLIPTVANPPAPCPPRTGGHSARETLVIDIIKARPKNSADRVVFDVPHEDREAARKALAEVAARRQAVVQARLLTKDVLG